MFVLKIITEKLYITANAMSYLMMFNILFEFILFKVFLNI